MAYNFLADKDDDDQFNVHNVHDAFAALDIHHDAGQQQQQPPPPQQQQQHGQISNGAPIGYDYSDIVYNLSKKAATSLGKKRKNIKEKYEVFLQISMPPKDQLDQDIGFVVVHGASMEKVINATTYINQLVRDLAAAGGAAAAAGGATAAAGGSAAIGGGIWSSFSR